MAFKSCVVWLTGLGTCPQLEVIDLSYGCGTTHFPLVAGFTCLHRPVVNEQDASKANGAHDSPSGGPSHPNGTESCSSRKEKASCGC